MNIGIIGATGYTGFELIKLLSRHSFFKLTTITSESYVGKRISEIYPSLTNVCDIVLTDNDFEAESKKADAFFLCLPHGASMQAAKILREKGKIVLDLSADFRIKDANIYKENYKTDHIAPLQLEEAVYGLAELFTDDIKKAQMVAVPGCYPTSIITPLYPLIREGLIDIKTIVADSKSGVSGAGRKPTLTNSFCEANEDFKPYGIFSHRHNAEIDYILGAKTIFTPHLLPINRGILSTIYTKSNFSINDVEKVWNKCYSDKRLIRVKQNGDIPSVKNVANSAFIDFAVFKKDENLIIVSAIDNLLKGASAQALQCLNIIANLNDFEGLI